MLVTDNLEALPRHPVNFVPLSTTITTWAVVVAWESKQRLQSKGTGIARDHLQDSGKKSDTPLPTYCLIDYKLISCLCVYMCVYIHWAPARVAFRLKAAPVKIRILYLLSFYIYLLY